MKYFVYVSIAGENRISIFEMAPDTGRLHFQADVPVSGGPAALAVDPQHGFLYASLRAIRQFVSFRIDRATGNLSPIGEVSLDADACFISTDRKGNFLLSSYYGAGKAAVHPIGSDGVVGGPPIEWLSTAERAHCILTDPANKFVFVPHTAGPNLIFQFIFDEKTGNLTPNTTPRVTPKAGEGPRHYVFHPTKDILYFSNEQGCSVTAYNFDSATGTLSAFQTISTLPDDFDGGNSCAQIHITPDGKFLYVSNRGHDSIACFSTDDATGRLTVLGQQPTQPTPRTFNIDPTGRFLFAAGQGSGKLTAYRIDEQSGALSPLDTYSVGENPMWVLGLELPG